MRTQFSQVFDIANNREGHPSEDLRGKSVVEDTRRELSKRLTHKERGEEFDDINY